MATTTDDTDYLGRALVTPATDARDYVGRIITSDTDFLGRATVETGGEPEPVELFAETWTGSNGATWNATRWPTQRTVETPPTIQGNAGSLAGNAGGNYAVASLDVTDFDLTVKVTSASALAGVFPEIGWRIGANIDGSASPDLGYVIQATSSSGGKVDMAKIAAYTIIGTAVATELNAVVTAWFRVRAVGTAHKARWWLDGDTEPGTWQIEVTDATYTTGRLILRNYSATAVLFDDLTVTAP